MKLHDVLEKVGAVEASLLAMLSTTEWTPDALTSLGSRASAFLAVDATLRGRFARPVPITDRVEQSVLRGPFGELVMAWVSGASGRRDVWLAGPIACALGGQGHTKTAARRALEDRVRRGPAVDALSVASHARKLGQLGNAALGRLDLVIWDVGGTRESVPDVGGWLLSSEDLCQALFARRVRGSLRERVLAARILAIGADGCSLENAGARGGLIREGLRLLLAHPEPRVWIPAAHAAGRLVRGSDEIRAWLLSWLRSPSGLERRRAATAIACAPADAGIDARRELTSVLDAEDVWTRAALGPAAPVMAAEHRELWDAFVERLIAPSAPVELLWSAAQGLVALRGRGDRRAANIASTLLGRTRAARYSDAGQAQLWLELKRDLELAETGQSEDLDVELVFDGLVRRALVGDEQVAAEHACRTAEKLPRATVNAWNSLVTQTDVLVIGRAAASLDALARSGALALWEPLACVAGREAPVVALDDAVRACGAALRGGGARFGTVRAALRLAGLCLDARPPRARGPLVAAIHSDLSMRARVTDNHGYGIEYFEKPISDVGARALEALSPEGAGGLGRLAAWAALAGHDLSIVKAMARADARVRTAGAEGIVQAAHLLGEALTTESPGALDGEWGGLVAALLESLGAGSSRLAQATSLLASVLRDARSAVADPSTTVLMPLIAGLGRVAMYLRVLVADPVIALEPAGDLRAFVPASPSDWVVRLDTEYALYDQLGRLGPIVAEGARALIAALRTRESAGPLGNRLGRFRVLEKMASSGMGEIWLVQDESQRRFVAKLAKGALEGAAGHARARLVEALQGEVASVINVQHPNVARVFGADFANDPPFVFMEYLVGADLEAWCAERRPTIAELQPIIADVASGLAALHSRGLVHRDLKLANVYLRLDVALPREGRFHFERAHRELPVRDAVVIDFGIAHRVVPAASDGTETAGTLGFMAPEQAGGTVLSAATDAYGLAATIFAALTGRAFFDDSTNSLQYQLRHYSEPPLGETGSILDLDHRVTTLLREATRLDPATRISVSELSRRFGAL